MQDLPQDINESRARTAPFADFIGREIVAMADGQSEVHFDIPDVFLNMQDILHGGAYAAMLDTACGVAIRGALDLDLYAGHVTLELKTNYLRAGKPGHYVARGTVLRLGKSVAFAEAILHDDEDAVVATASATFKLRKRK